jgi:hypothetical protein
LASNPRILTYRQRLIGHTEDPADLIHSRYVLPRTDFCEPKMRLIFVQFPINHLPKDIRSGILQLFAERSDVIDKIRQRHSKKGL